MIIEGSHKATGSGIFVSDIQEKSAAFHVSYKQKEEIIQIITSLFFSLGLKLVT